jgi:multidrug resistance efflux pump
MIDAEADLEDAEEMLSDHQDLDEDNPVRKRYEDDVEEAQQDYDEARWAYEELKNHKDLVEAQLETAQAAVEDAERRVEATRDGPDPDVLSLTTASLDQAQGQLRAAERAINDIELTAPFAGQIVQVELTEGALISPEHMAIVVADMSEWVLETNDLTEQEVVSITEGDEVTITFDALPDLEFSGVVESISDYALERFGDVTYVVRIQLADPDLRLRWGMTAEVEFPE